MPPKTEPTDPTDGETSDTAPAAVVGDLVTLDAETDEDGPTLAVVASVDPLTVVKLGKAVPYGLDVVKA